MSKLAPFDLDLGEVCFCLRLDVDTLRDVKALSILLNLVEEFDVKATVFVSTGKDDSAMDLPGALLRALRGRYLRRYGLDPLRALLSSTGVEDSSDWRSPLDGTHELGLHGFRHRQWIHSAQSWDAKEADGVVEVATELFKKRFGLTPRSFAAPGFVITPQVYLSLEKHGFLYSSNSVAHGVVPFRPQVGGRRLSLVEMPVTCHNVEELMLGGATRQAALRMVEKKFQEATESTRYFCYYVHPSHEVFVGRNDLKHLLTRFVAISTVWAPTMGEAVRSIENQVQ